MHPSPARPCANKCYIAWTECHISLCQHLEPVTHSSLWFEWYYISCANGITTPCTCRCISGNELKVVQEPEIQAPNAKNEEWIGWLTYMWHNCLILYRRCSFIELQYGESNIHTAPYLNVIVIYLSSKAI